MLHCTTVWSFNQKSLEEKCSTIESAKKSKTIKKVTGQKHVQIFGKYIYDLKSGTSKAKAMSTLISGSLFFKTWTPIEQVKRNRTTVTDWHVQAKIQEEENQHQARGQCQWDANHATIKLQQQIDMYTQRFKKKSAITKSEDNLNGMLITPEMGGKIVLSVLQKYKSHITHVSAEIAEHGLEQPTSIDNMKCKEVHSRSA